MFIISKHVRVTAESNKGAELEAPKLDLDWDIAPSAFVELEFDKLQDGHKLKYPLSSNFVSDEGKMRGFFVYPQEYKGVEPTDSQSTTPKGKPSALSVNVNRINDTERYFTLKDINAPIGSTKRGKVYDAMNQGIASLHNADYKAIGLEDFGQPGNYISRQLKRWGKQYLDADYERITEMDLLIDWLEAKEAKSS